MPRPINVEVEIYHPDQTGRMVKKFNRKVKKSGILEELRERRYYTKPSVKRRLKRKNKKRRSQESTRKYNEKFDVS